MQNGVYAYIIWVGAFYLVLASLRCWIQQHEFDKNIDNVTKIHKSIVMRINADQY